jgi:hypothetical protein
MNPRPLRAICPACTRLLTGVELGGEFPRHMHPRTDAVRGRCAFSGSIVRRAHLVHPCITCAALPVAPSVMDGVYRAPDSVMEFRPAEPRPLDPESGPRIPECATHRRARLAAQKARRRASARVRDRGVAEEDRDELWAAQGSACICGRALTSTGKAPTLDHDHRRAAGHDHDTVKACRRCARGALCDTCNRVLVGRYSPTQLRMVARYIEHPTAELLGWWDD